MNKNMLFFGAIFVALLSLCFLFVLRVVPTTQIWDKYNVLYVDSSVEVQTVREALLSQNIEGVLYPDHDVFPQPSTLAPVQYHQFSLGVSYDQLQTSFFIDKDGQYHLFYIPVGNNEAVFNALESFTYPWGLDIQATIPTLPFIVCAFLTIILAYYARNKWYFLLIQIPFVLYSFVVPFYHIGSSVCIFTLAVFMVQKYWDREYQMQKIFKNVFTICSLTFLLVGSALLGFRVLFLLLLSCLASISLCYIVYSIKRTAYQKSAFKPTQIHTAKTVRLHNVFNVKYLLLGFTAILLLTVFAILNIQPLKNNLKKALHIPTPSGYTIAGDFSAQSYEQLILESKPEDIGRLPNFSDFVNLAWHFETYPYLKLGEKPSAVVHTGDTIEQVDYLRNGFELQEQISVIATFDDAYIQEVIHSAFTSTNAGAEKLLASQKGFAHVSYAQSGTMTSPTGAIIFLLMSCAFMLYFIFVLKLKRR